jgi:hypothetical protein
MFKKFSLVVLMIIGVISLAGADILVTYSQSQLDGLNLDAYTWQTFDCKIVYPDYCQQDICYFAGNFYTFYSCIDFQAERLNETDYIYFFHNDSVFHTQVNYDWIFGIYNETNFTWATYVYWQEAGEQAKAQVEAIKDNIRRYQTKEDVWDGWNGTLFE